jgi:hypothetical protein
MSDRLKQILADLRADLTEAEREASDNLVAKLKAKKEAEAVAKVASAREALSEENPDALWADGFEAAYIGQAHRCGQPTLAAFSVKKCLQILMERDGMTYEEADEFFEFNVSGAWVGAGTPIWIYDTEDEG